MGDAVHLTGPVGMQSMNAGLQEAASDRGHDRPDPATGPPSISLTPRARTPKTLEEWAFLHGRAGRLKPTSSAPPPVASRVDRLLPCLPGTGDELDAIARSLGLTVERV